MDADCNWDEEAIERAIAQAQAVEQWDPDAARQLMAQAQSAKQKRGDATPLHEPYDPMALQSRVVEFYNGGITDADCDRMSYRRFFGYVREAELIAEERDKKHKANQGGQSTPMEISEALGSIPKPEKYTGEVRKLI